MSPLIKIAPLFALVMAGNAYAVDVNIVQHNYPNGRNPNASRYQYPSGYGNVVTPYPEPRISLPYTGPVPARDRAEYMQEYMERTEQELKDEKDPPLTRSEFEEILDRKLEEKLAKKQGAPIKAQEPSPFGAVGGLGKVGGTGTVSAQ